MPRLLLCLLVLLAVALADPGPAAAQYGPQPRHQLYYQSTTIARANPLGLISVIQLSYRHRLYEHHSIFLRNNHIAMGALGAMSPAFGRIGAYLEVQPIPMVTMFGLYEVVGYFGSFDLMSSYPSPDADFSDSAQDDGDSYSTMGHQLTVGLTLQMLLGPVAIRNQIRAVRGDYDLRAGDGYYYDSPFDALIEDGGWMLTDDLDLVYIHADRWTAGVRYTITQTWYADFDGNPNGPFDRLGVLAAYTFFKKYKARFNGPTVFLLSQWHLRHRWRTGEDVSQAFPTIVLGFDFRGDLLPLPSG